mgnify:CR=1 FL=1
MEFTTLGKTGLNVSRLGAGLGQLGGLPADDVETAGRILGAALDGGVNFFDTGECYGNSEELIGRFISHRRSEYYLATKCGCMVRDTPPPPGQRFPHIFTRENVVAGVTQSLVRMKTDHLDLVQIHSCDLSVLERGAAGGEGCRQDAARRLQR